MEFFFNVSANMLIKIPSFRHQIDKTCCCSINRNSRSILMLSTFLTEFHMEKFLKIKYSTFDISVTDWVGIGIPKYQKYREIPKIWIRKISMLPNPGNLNPYPEIPKITNFWISERISGIPFFEMFFFFFNFPYFLVIFQYSLVFSSIFKTKNVW